MNDSIPPRAKRREYLNQLRKKARLRAERKYQEQFFNGGCKIARCGMCDHFTPSYRTNKQHDQFNREYEDWLRGDFREPFE